MDPIGQQRRYPWLLGLVAIVAVISGGLALGIGRSDSPPGDQLPASPVLGMADPNAPALPSGADDATARPVIQVDTDTADGSAVITSPSAGAEASTVVSSTTSTVAPATSTTVVVTSSTVPSSLPPVSEPPGSSTTAIGAGSSTTIPPASDPPSTSTLPGGESLNAVELELAQLTNELRTNPNGPMRREGVVIDCGGRIPIDPATGLYQPVGALIVDPVASLQVARGWSAQLTTDLQHRPQAGIGALQGAGIDVAAAGENIAYHNFPDTASQHFVGWRESDGHFCNMMDPTFTHLGVGEITRSDGFSFATQNFFSLR